MEMRKLVQSGLGSYVISVPKHWLDQHKLGKGDVLSIDRQGDNLVLLPGQREKRVQRKRVVFSAEHSIGVLTRRLIAAYIAGCAEIVIRGGRDYEKDKVLCQQIECLAGYEIVEKRKDRLVINDLLRIEDLSLRETFRKMDNTLRMMLGEFRDMLKGESRNAAVLIEDDRLLNKLHYTIARLTRAVLRNELLQKEYAELYEVLILDYLSTIVEDLGDHLKYLAQETAALSAAQRWELRPVVEKICRMYEQLLQAYYQQDEEAPYSCISAKEALQRECKALLGKHRQKEMVIVSRRLKSIVLALAQIAKVLRYR